jgi:hypothetical protein
MTPEELDKATADEAWRLLEEGQDVAVIAARLAREGWKPPEPVDPDVLAYREWGSKIENAAYREAVLAGEWDHCFAAKAFVAGARMARAQEQERAKVLVDYLDEASGFLGHFIPESAALKARNILAAYKAGKPTP